MHDEGAAVTVVIPTYNGRGLLEPCLESLRRQTLGSFCVLVVDDASTDGTADFLRERRDGVHVLRLAENLGFCAAVNAGLRACDTPWVMLLNNDMTLEPTCLERLVEAGESGEAALIAPLVLSADDPGTIYAAGDRLRIDGRPESIGHGAPVASFPISREVFGVSAGASLCRADVFGRIGLFDEDFLAYFSDGDLSLRARLAGFSARCVPEAVAFHEGSATYGPRRLWRARQCCRNHAVLVLKNYPLALIRRNFAAILAERLRQYRRVFVVGRDRAGAARGLAEVMRTWWSVLCILPRVPGKRRRVQRRRQVSVEQLELMLTHPNTPDGIS